MAFVVQDADIPARDRLAGRAVFRREKLDARGIADHGHAGFSLPVVIQHGDAQGPLNPFHRLRIGTLACKKYRPQLRQVVLCREVSDWVLTADRPKGRGRGKKCRDLVLGHDTVKGRGIRGADGLALVDHRGRALRQRAITGV